MSIYNFNEDQIINKIINLYNEKTNKIQVIDKPDRLNRILLTGYHD